MSTHLSDTELCSWGSVDALINNTKVNFSWGHSEIREETPRVALEKEINKEREKGRGRERESARERERERERKKKRKRGRGEGERERKRVREREGGGENEIERGGRDGQRERWRGGVGEWLIINLGPKGPTHRK